MRPVIVVSPSGSRAPRPIVVEVPHAGIQVPPEVRSELLLDESAIRRDADLYMDRLYRDAPALGAVLVYTEISRFVIDLNRAEGDVDSLSVVGHPAPRADAPRGLIWRIATDGTRAIARP